MLDKLKAKHEELSKSYPSLSDDKYRNADFAQYEVDSKKHMYDIECLAVAINKLETATKVRHAISLID